MATENATDEDADFNDIAPRVTFVAANHTPGGNEAVRLNNTRTVAVSKSLSVMPGDTVDLEVWAYYEGGSGYSNSVGSATLISAIASAFGGVSGVGGESQAIYDGINGGIGALGMGGTGDDEVPAAYLNYLLFDKDYNFITGGFEQVTSAGDFSKELVSFSQPITVTEAGYLFVYLSNESNTTNWVYFDDLKITDTKSPVIQSDDYYPFGLTFNSYKRENAVENQYLFVGKERQDELEIGWFDFGARMYAPEIARWNGIDASAENYVNQSPYHYAGNNPVIFVDYDGNDYGLSVNHDSKTITISAKFISNSRNKSALDRALASFNGQSGSFKYVIGTGKDRVVYDVVFDLTSEAVDGGTGDPSSGGYISEGDKLVDSDLTGEVNSFDTVPDNYQGGSFRDGVGVETSGSSDGKKISVREGKKHTKTSEHEVGHNLGLSHTSGLMGKFGGSTIDASHVTEILAGGAVGGDGQETKSKNGLGSGARRPDSGGPIKGGYYGNWFNSGKVMSSRKLERVLRREERREKKNIE